MLESPPIWSAKFAQVGHKDTTQLGFYSCRVQFQFYFLLQIPVYKGCEVSLLGEGRSLCGYHGNDGLGDVIHSHEPSEHLVKDQHAANALVSLVNKYPGSQPSQLTKRLQHPTSTVMNLSELIRHSHYNSIYNRETFPNSYHLVFVDEITLIATGPLTNIALALRLDPKFGTKLKQCIIMGGNTKGKEAG